jgi:hypothetical protein
VKRSRYLKQLVLGSVAATVGMLSSGNAAADIISTGGTLTNVSPAAVGTGAVSFNATHTTRVTDYNPVGQPYQIDFTDTSVVGSIGPSAVSLNAQAKTWTGVTGVQAQGHATGTLGFDLTQSGAATFSWANLVNSIQPRDSLVIKAADGSIVLGCVGSSSYYGVAGGCEAGAQPRGDDPSASLLQQGAFNLAAGAYSLFFSIASGPYVGTSDNAGYAFSLNVTPVPLPAGLSLLLCGLAALCLVSNRLTALVAPVTRSQALSCG